jgi:hypothetical protein
MQPVKHFRPEGADNRFRAQRFRLFKSLVDDILSKQKSCRILDIGGTPEYWERFGNELDASRVDISVLNLAARPETFPHVKVLVGDARKMGQFNDLSFDVIHSNSVIEHVGRWDDMASMAQEVRRLAPRYFVQTPYFWFPIEPHARFPLLHWMPESWRYRILMRRTCGFWQRREDVGSATRAIQSALLLDKQQMRFLFPDADVISEKFFGLTKSLIAIR